MSSSSTFISLSTKFPNFNEKHVTSSFPQSRFQGCSFDLWWRSNGQYRENPPTFPTHLEEVILLMENIPQPSAVRRKCMIASMSDQQSDQRHISQARRGDLSCHDYLEIVRVHGGRRPFGRRYHEKNGRSQQIRWRSPPPRSRLQGGEESVGKRLRHFGGEVADCVGMFSRQWITAMMRKIERTGGSLGDRSLQLASVVDRLGGCRSRLGVGD